MLREFLLNNKPILAIGLQMSTSFVARLKILLPTKVYWWLKISIFQLQFLVTSRSSYENLCICQKSMLLENILFLLQDLGLVKLSKCLTDVTKSVKPQVIKFSCIHMTKFCVLIFCVFYSIQYNYVPHMKLSKFLTDINNQVIHIDILAFSIIMFYISHMQNRQVRLKQTATFSAEPRRSSRARNQVSYCDDVRLKAFKLTMLATSLKLKRSTFTM